MANRTVLHGLNHQAAVELSDAGLATLTSALSSAHAALVPSDKQCIHLHFCEVSESQRAVCESMWPTAVPLAGHHVCLVSPVLRPSLQRCGRLQQVRNKSHSSARVVNRERSASRSCVCHHSCHRTFSRHQKRHGLRPLQAAADQPQGSGQSQSVPVPQVSGILVNLQKAGKRQLRKLDGLWGRFIPMVTL